MRSAAERSSAGPPSLLYLPELRASATRFTLAGDEAHYAARVVRVRDGDRVRATDGAGRIATLRVERVRPALELAIEHAEDVPRPARACILCGAPEGERGDWLVEKLAELGVTELVPVDTERARWPGRARDARWERLAVAALRQSRSAWRLELCAPVQLAEALRGARTGIRWLADPAGAAADRSAIAQGEPVSAAVGPAPGFTDRERNALLECGFVPVRLAAQRLRTETAAVAVAALWAAARSAAGPGPGAPA